MLDWPQSIGEKELEDADTDVIWQQIGRTLLLEVGARDLVFMRDGVMFAFGPESETKYRKIIVKLNGMDLYEVEVGFLWRPALDWMVVEQESDAYAEDLPETVRRLVERGLET